MTKIDEFRKVATAPPGSMLAEERLERCNALADEMTDLLLETPEPHRNKLLKMVLSTREKVRALKVPE